MKMAENLALKRLQILSRCLKTMEYSECCARPSLHLSKNDVLIDEKVRITVKGLAKNQKVTLHSLLEDSSKLYAACGHYVANEAGEVDTFQHSSFGGTFEGVESMGLFWSLKYQNLSSPRRLIKKDVTTPFEVKIAVHDGFVKFEDLPWTGDFSCLIDCVLRRHFMVPGVQRISVKENGLYGTLFLPPGKGPFPAVIDIFGMAGGILEIRSPLLASHGIAAFSLGYVNFEDLPKNDSELDYHYFLRAFDWLAAHPAIDENALGGVSTCVGGAYLGVIAMKRSSIWRHGTKVLQIHGLDDQCVHPAVGKKFQNAVPEELQTNFTLVEYPGAGHLLEIPYMPLCQASYNQIYRSYLLWGGKPKPHAHAEEDCWAKILNFLYAHLKNGAKCS